MTFNNLCEKNVLCPWETAAIIQYDATMLRLKGQCHAIFDLRFFAWLIFPPGPWVLFPISTISKFSENSLRYSQFKVHKRINDTGSKLTTGVVDTGGKFIASVNDSGGGNDTTVVNDGQLSTTPVANKEISSRLPTP